jgi:FXSXX-COOH protein
VLYQRGRYTMDSLSADRESGIESELIDLSAVPMAVLRESEDTALRQAVRQVMQQAAHSPATVCAGWDGRID